MEFQSWGHYPLGTHKSVQKFEPGFDIASSRASTVLPFGCGRSYGDSCLNFGQGILTIENLRRFLSFDVNTGIVRVETGVTLAELLQFCVPKGWFPPVLPGTRFVSVGGAVANDIHGKNHHRAGSIGCHVLRIELLRTTGERLILSKDENRDLFDATIGGLGLTGLMISVDLQLKPIPGPFIDREFVFFQGLEEFLQLSRDSAESHEYSVAWLDILGQGSNFFRGIFFRGNTSSEGGTQVPEIKNPKLFVPRAFPSGLMSPTSMRMFNFCYRQGHRLLQPRSKVSYLPFFFPLDAVKDWNRVYGKTGMTQFQCVVPNTEVGHSALLRILEIAVQQGSGSFLSVLKLFGNRLSPGMLSFPRPGLTLTMDFPATTSTFEMLKRLEREVVEASGAIYPAKDASMSSESFEVYFPKWAQFEKFRDPGISSSFWRRVRDQ